MTEQEQLDAWAAQKSQEVGSLGNAIAFAIRIISALDAWKKGTATDAEIALLDENMPTDEARQRFRAQVASRRTEAGETHV